jgi:hypothetical protein
MWSTSRDGVYGFEWFIVILAFVVDLSSWVRGGRGRGPSRARTAS